MKKIRVLFSMALMIMLLYSINQASAAENVIVLGEYGEKAVYSGSIKADIDGDGKTDDIKVTSKKNTKYYGIKNLKISVNGQNVFSVKDNAGYTFIVEYIKGKGKNDVYLHIKNTFDNGDPEIDGLYTYNKSSKKLNKLIGFDSEKSPKGGYHIYTRAIKAGNKSIEVEYYGQLMTTGYINYSLKYKYKNGKYIPGSNTGKIIKGKKYTASKSITFYKNAGSSKKAYEIKKGDSVVLKKIKKTNGGYYLMFLSGKKKGWLSAETSDVFEGVQLAG